MGRTFLGGTDPVGTVSEGPADAHDWNDLPAFLVPTSYGPLRRSSPTVRTPGGCSAPIGAKRDSMNTFKSHAFRIVTFLSVLASYAFVIDAGRRW